MPQEIPADWLMRFEEDNARRPLFKRLAPRPTHT